MREAGMEVRKNREDSTLASDRLLVLGEINRVTDFEKGMPGMEAQINGEWVKDPFPDDRGVVVKVKNKGLVVIGGCSHAGIINTVKHAQKVTGVSKVYAVLGGFHLTGPMMEPIIAPTIAEMKKFNPDYIVPTHCTGLESDQSICQGDGGSVYPKHGGDDLYFWVGQSRDQLIKAKKMLGAK